jgi:outer membrane protein OmpA-like peptidoglycan-associated protein/CheY-like chemotaxis protein
LSTMLCVLPGKLGQFYAREVATLEARGVGVLREESPSVALSMVGAQRPQLVVTGLSMAEMEGLEFLAQVQQYHGDVDAALVVLPDPGDAIDPLVCLRDKITGRYSVDHYAGAQIWQRIAELCGVADGAPAAQPLAPVDQRERPWEQEPGSAPPGGGLGLPPLGAPPPVFDPRGPRPSASMTAAPPPASEAIVEMAAAPGAAPGAAPVPAAPAPQPQRGSSRIVVVVIAVVVVLAAAAVGLYFVLGAPSPPAPPPPPVTKLAPRPAAPAPAPAPASAPAPTPAAAPAPASAPARLEPPAAGPSLSRSGTHVLALTFSQGSPKPTITDEDALRALATAVPAARACRLTLAGHTSAEGDRRFNLFLGRERARAARALLAERGASASLFATRTAGAAEPVAGASADAANRRVVLEVQCP